MRMGLITHNFTLKLFSLMVALVLFFIVGVESDTPVDVDFRIEYRTADDITVTGDPPRMLHTTLQGPWTSFRSFDIHELPPVSIDLTDAGPGVVRYRIDTSQIQPPAGMNVLSIRPAEVELQLDRQVERLVPVQADITGRPAFGYEILDIVTEPPRVRVVGPMTQMQLVDFVYTRPIDVEGREEDLTTNVDLRLPSPPLRLKDREVVVRIDIGEELVTRSFGNLSVEVDNAPKGTKISPRVVTIKLRGPRRIVDRLERDAVQPYIELEPELLEAGVPAERTVKLRSIPEKTQIVGPMSRVQVELPRSRGR